MDFQDMEAAIKSAADSLRKTPAVRKGKNSYAIVVKVGYEEVKKLREDGYSYETICKIFSEKGLLGDNASHKSFCTAFLRETKRRMPQTDGRNPSVGTGSAPVKKTEAAANAERSKSEQERIKRLLSSKLNIGVGNTVKNSDGTFEIL